MCHAIPAEVVEVLPGEMARVDLSGARKTVSTALVGAVAVGDYLLVHVGYALGRVDPAEAEATLRLLEEIGAGR
ncbi:HypC/HybG/HupF family hydrogenase formation chaperone [Roseicyclus sp.]|uniref:HypC/HybG/HupF family hydrogenase formation chaperone n=1 Tax=Roseicyclus sp. TaxID=1914329 RepID=UPI003F9FAE82